MPTTDASSAPPTLNIPSLIAFAVLAFLAIRYFFFNPSSSSSQNQRSYPGSSANRSARRQQRQAVPPEKIETVASMFPQLRRRDIEWDLLRNGASVQACCEKVLREGRLSQAPPSFRASTPPPSPAPSASGGHGTSTQKAPQHEDLITRYNLGSRLQEMEDANRKGKERVAEAGSGDASPIQTTETQQAKGSWSSSKGERAALLKKRREDMILEARRKMMEQDASRVAGS